MTHIIHSANIYWVTITADTVQDTWKRAVIRKFLHLPEFIIKLVIWLKLHVLQKRNREWKESTKSKNLEKNKENRQTPGRIGLLQATFNVFDVSKPRWEGTENDAIRTAF